MTTTEPKGDDEKKVPKRAPRKRKYEKTRIQYNDRQEYMRLYMDRYRNKPCKIDREPVLDTPTIP